MCPPAGGDVSLSHVSLNPTPKNDARLYLTCATLFSWKKYTTNVSPGATNTESAKFWFRVQLASQITVELVVDQVPATQRTWLRTSKRYQAAARARRIEWGVDGGTKGVGFVVILNELCTVYNTMPILWVTLSFYCDLHHSKEQLLMWLISRKLG